ncbi:MAG: RNA-binding protein, partial [Agathobacter sp.]|nr:RNA-binding protein [Agathobacter sp.]
MKLGEFQTLICIKKVEFGIYLAERKDSEDKVLL